MSAKSATKVCSNCNGTVFDTDNISGETCCVGCGFVISCNNLVSEVEFEDRGTRSKAVGKFISTDVDERGRSLKASHEACISRIREFMLNIACQLSLNHNFVESALTFYRMALQRNLTRARRSEHVAVACLYMCCRIEKTSHLLTDFSEAVQLDIFTLGRTFLFLSRELCIHLPVIDPCLYIQRFGHRLKFGDKTHVICMTAVRLVSRMKRDWIHHGRRPSGLCGAALLVASKLHGVTRSIRQIVRVVRISSSVLMKRLTDFSQTPAANLTYDEFKDLEIDTEADPPSFVRSQQNIDRYKQLEQSAYWIDTKILENVTKTQKEIEIVMGIRQVIETGLLATQSHSNSAISSSLSSPSRDFNRESVNSSSEYYPLKNREKMNCENVQSKNPDNSQSKTPKKNDQDVENDDTQEDELATFSDLDDDEIENCILTNEEIEYKTKVWNEENETFLAEKQKKIEARAKLNENKKRRKRKVVNENVNNGQPTQDGESKNRVKVDDDIKREIIDNTKRDLAQTYDSLSKSNNSEPATDLLQPENPTATNNIESERDILSQQLSFKKSNLFDKILKTGKYTGRNVPKISIPKVLKKKA